jgi:acetolactate synthase-1/3 small subunit
VVKISELAPSESVERELLMATVAVSPDVRGQVIELVQVYEGRIVSVAADALTVCLDGHPDTLDDFEELLRGYGIVELQRSGRIAPPKLPRGSRPPARVRRIGRAS